MTQNEKTNAVYKISINRVKIQEAQLRTDNRQKYITSNIV